jgi:hypothetical protein
MVALVIALALAKVKENPSGKYQIEQDARDFPNKF